MKTKITIITSALAALLLCACKGTAQVPPANAIEIKQRDATGSDWVYRSLVPAPDSLLFFGADRAPGTVPIGSGLSLTGGTLSTSFPLIAPNGRGGYMSLSTQPTTTAENIRFLITNRLSLANPDLSANTLSGGDIITFYDIANAGKIQASKTQHGVVKIGDGLNVTDGVISATAAAGGLPIIIGNKYSPSTTISATDGILSIYGSYVHQTSPDTIAVEMATLKMTPVGLFNSGLMRISGVAPPDAANDAATKSYVDAATGFPFTGNNISITNPSSRNLLIAVAEGGNGSIILDAQNGGSVILRGDTGAGAATLELDDRVALSGAYGAGKIAIEGYGEGQDGIRLFSTDPIWMRNTADTLYQRIKIAAGTEADDAINKSQLDDALAGVSPRFPFIGDGVSITNPNTDELRIAQIDASIELTPYAGINIKSLGILKLESENPMGIDMKASVGEFNMAGSLMFITGKNGLYLASNDEIKLRSDQPIGMETPGRQPQRLQIADPVDNKDAATKNYVDTALAGISTGFPVTGSNGASITQDATGNVTISGNQVLIKALEMVFLPQTLASNGDHFYIIDKNGLSAPIWIADGTASGQAITKAQLDAAIASVSTAGGSGTAWHDMQSTQSTVSLKENNGNVTLAGDFIYLRSTSGGNVDLTGNQIWLRGGEDIIYMSSRIAPSTPSQYFSGFYFWNPNGNPAPISIASGTRADQAITKAQLDDAILYITTGSSGGNYDTGDFPLTGDGITLTNPSAGQLVITGSSKSEYSDSYYTSTLSIAPRNFEYKNSNGYGLSMNQDTTRISNNQIYLTAGETIYMSPSIQSTGNAFYFTDKNWNPAPIHIASGTAADQAVTKGQLDTALAGSAGFPINGNGVSLTNPAANQFIAQGGNNNIIIGPNTVRINTGEVALLSTSPVVALYADESGFQRVKGGDPEEDNDFTTKSYVDSKPAVLPLSGNFTTISEPNNYTTLLKSQAPGYAASSIELSQGDVILRSADTVTFIGKFAFNSWSSNSYLQATGNTTTDKIKAGNRLTYAGSVDPDANGDYITKGYADAHYSGGSGGSSLWTQDANNIYYNSGNVGIGTEYPGAPLTVMQTERNNEYHKVFQVFSSALESGDKVQFAVGKGDSSYNSAEFNFYYDDDYSDNNRFSLGLNDAPTIITLTAQENVGIGNEEPAYKLDVTGDINLTGDIYKNGEVWNPAGGGLPIGGDGVSITNPSQNTLDIMAHGEHYITILEDSNLYIGSLGKITLEAQTDVSIQAYGKISVAGNGDAIFGGQNARIEGDSSITLWSNGPINIEGGFDSGVYVTGPEFTVGADGDNKRFSLGGDGITMSSEDGQIQILAHGSMLTVNTDDTLVLYGEYASLTGNNSFSITGAGVSITNPYPDQLEIYADTSISLNSQNEDVRIKGYGVTITNREGASDPIRIGNASEEGNNININGSTYDTIKVQVGNPDGGNGAGIRIIGNGSNDSPDGGFRIQINRGNGQGWVDL